MILKKSFDMFRQSGMGSVNARSVAKALNCSTQPIFSYFSGMDDLKSALDEKAQECYDECVACTDGLSLESFCNAYVHFADEQPRLFAHLFLQSGRTVDVMPLDEYKRNAIIAMECESAELSDEQAKELCKSVWLYAHGLAAARAVCLMEMTDDAVCNQISRIHQGEILRIKQESF